MNPGKRRAALRADTHPGVPGDPRHGSRPGERLLGAGEKTPQGFLPGREDLSDGPPPVAGDCWRWDGATTAKGYPRLGDDYAHRAAWVFFRGPIPPGWWVRHLCPMRRCVNPDHLDAAPPALILSRDEQTHCHRGHPLSGENLYRAPDGRRTCRECRKVRQRPRAASRP